MEAAAASSNKRLKTSATLVNWADLLPELLPAIAERIGVYEDFTAFRGVCKSWRSATEETKFSPSPDQLPWLMLAEEIQDKREDEEEKEEDDEDNARDCEDCNSRKFFGLWKKGMIRRVELPEARFKHCTSSLGWLITTDKEGNTDLLHSLTRGRIPLPHLGSFTHYEGETLPIRLYMQRATLSASPSLSNDYVLMVILGQYTRLAYWKPGDKTWNFIVSNQHYDNADIIFYKDQFVTIDIQGSVHGWNIGKPNSESHNTLATIRDDHYHSIYDYVYLVESAGKLLAVARYTFDKTQKKYMRTTTYFNVFEFEGSCRRRKINSLEGRSVFVGHNTSFSCHVDEATMAIKPNCIYFTDDFSLRYHLDPLSNDMGVYSLEDERLVNEHNIGDRWCSRYCPALWVMPSF